MYDWKKTSLQLSFLYETSIMYVQGVTWSQFFSCLGVSFYRSLIFWQSDLEMLQIYVLETKNLFMLFSSSVNFIMHFILQLLQIYFTFPFPSAVDKRNMCKPDAQLVSWHFFHFEGCHFCFCCKNNAGFLAFMQSLLNLRPEIFQIPRGSKEYLKKWASYQSFLNSSRASFHHPNCNKSF